MFERPAVFLDRDGVLTEEKGYVISKNHLSISPYTQDCIRQIHRKGYYAIVITNQSGVARGLFSEERLEDHNVISGLGRAVAEVIAESGLGVKLKRIGIQDFSIGYGSYAEVKEMNGIGKEQIFDEISEWL